MKTIGIVAEGPRDFELIAAVIDTITNEENSYQMIQPEPDMAGRFGNGWKGVWKWCETNQGSLNTYMNSLTPVLDFLVIHMDGDVERCEKEVIVNVKENSVMHQRAHTRLLAKKLRTTGVIVLSFYRAKSMEILQKQGQIF